MAATRELSQLNLIDNFLFTTLMDHEAYGPVAAKNILEIILDREVNIRKVHAEKVILPSNPSLHGIRMDAVIEEGRTEVSPGEIFDVEPDNKRRDKDQLHHRARYYHSRMDGKLLESDTRYSRLPGAWVIFITPFDPFGEDRMVYTIKNHCVEMPELRYEDGSTTIFLYIRGTKGNPPQKVQELLTYFDETTVTNAKNEKLAEVQSCIDNLKMDPYVKEAYMTWDEYIQYEREEAAEAANRRAEEAERRAEESNRRAEESDRRAEESDRRAEESDRRAEESDRRTEAAEREVAILKKKSDELKAINNG